MAVKTGDISMHDSISTLDNATRTSIDQTIEAGDDSSPGETTSTSCDEIFDALSVYSQSTATSTDDLETREEAYLRTQEHTEGEHLPSEETRERLNAIVREGMRELRAMLAEFRKEVRDLFEEWRTRTELRDDESEKRLDRAFASGKKVSTPELPPLSSAFAIRCISKLIADRKKHRALKKAHRRPWLARRADEKSTAFLLKC